MRDLSKIFGISFKMYHHGFHLMTFNNIPMHNDLVDIYSLDAIAEREEIYWLFLYFQMPQQNCRAIILKNSPLTAYRYSFLVPFQPGQYDVIIVNTRTYIISFSFSFTIKLFLPSPGGTNLFSISSQLPYMCPSLAVRRRQLFIILTPAFHFGKASDLL